MTKEHAPTPTPSKAPASDAKLVHEPERHKRSSARGDAIAKGVGHWNLTTMHTVNLGDVDRRSTHTFPIYYLGSGTQGPRIDAKLTGDPAIRLLRAPMALPASSQPYSENNHFKVDFNPQRLGRFESVLEIDVLESPHERHRVPVVGESHAPGQPTREEQEKSDQRRKSDEHGQHERQRKLEAEDARLEKYLQRNRVFHSGAETKLHEARDRIRDQLSALLATRKEGVDAAYRLVSKFKRVPPNNDPGLLFSLAMDAMRVVTAGIGAAVAKRLEPIVKEMMTEITSSGVGLRRTTTHIPPSETFVAFISESIESAVQTIGGAAIDKLRPSPSVGPSTNGGAMVEFFRIEGDAIIKDHTASALNTAIRATRSVKPLLESKPDAVAFPPGAQEGIDGLNKMAEGIGAEREAASALQKRESVKHWVRYLAESDMAGRNPSQLRNVGGKYDGLVDLTFSAPQANAQQPVVVTHARFNGVQKEVISSIINTPLAQTGLAIRASCQFSPEQAVIVLKRPDGDVEYTDTPAEAGSWLAKKAGVRARPLEADKARGARVLFEEIARKSLQQHLTGGLHTMVGDATRFVENDSDES